MGKGAELWQTAHGKVSDRTRRMLSQAVLVRKMVRAVKEKWEGTWVTLEQSWRCSWRPKVDRQHLQNKEHGLGMELDSH